MNSTRISYAFLPVMAMVIASCAKEVQEKTYVEAPEIIACQESDGETKTQLVVDGDGNGTIYWKPADQINVFYGTESILYTSKNTENVTTASFKTTEVIGATEEASTNIWGLYPYDEDATCDGSKVTTTIPSTQYGVPETFDDDLFTTLAHSTSTVLKFYNVCGGIKFSLSRSDIKKITFSGNNNETIAGKVDLTFVDGLPSVTSVTASTTITLTPKTGDTFQKDVNYYIVTLPVSMAGGFEMTFETEDKIGTFNYTTKAVAVSRSKFSKKANIDTYATFVDKEVTDLSSSGTANCYIVSEAGRYKFKTVQGNSTTSVGDVKGVKVLWESFGTDVTPSVGDIIDGDVTYADNYITFSTNSTFTEGNAVIAAYSDADCTDGNVLWSWHIWCTDQPEGQVYYNNAGTMMDRNLGATSAIPGDVHSLGLLYQWGRKDPFLGGSQISYSSESNQNCAVSTNTWPKPVKSTQWTGKISYTIANPCTFLRCNDNNDDWCYSNTDETDNTRWQASKTIYDPCPSGWRVPSGGKNGEWATAFGTSEDWTTKSNWDSENHGMNYGTTDITLGSAINIWYPSSGFKNDNGEICGVGSTGFYYSYTPWDEEILSLYFTYSGYTDSWDSDGRSYGYAVRCLSESSQTIVPVESVEISLSSVGICVGKAKQLSASVLPINANVTTVSWSSSNESIAYVSSTGLVTAIAEGNCIITAKAYNGVKSECAVTVTRDLSYSEPANCYIVSSVGTYRFKTVQGNSNTSVGVVEGVKVLWETFGTWEAPSVGDLIKANVSYSDNYITFSTNDTFKKGNAVIAAYSDSDCTDDNVLWSWHIWLTDQPDEQVYYNNAGIMMDRNLGATSAIPGALGTEGLLYQWGRKDPFIGCSKSNYARATISNGKYINSSSGLITAPSDETYGTISYATSHPRVFIRRNELNWDWYYTGDQYTDSDRWSTVKTKYDPCPEGWRVSDGKATGVWATAFGSSSEYSDGPSDATNIGMDFGSGNGKPINQQLGADDVIWYPATGYISGGGTLDFQAVRGSIWSCDMPYYSYFYIGSGFVAPSQCQVPAYGRSVRCQKIQ